MEDEEPDVILLPCSHAFHGDCILRWVENNFSCPTCRATVGSFVPLNGSKIRDEFNDLWNQHYLENPTTKEDSTITTEEDNLKKQAIQPGVEVVIDMDEFDMLLEEEVKISEKASSKESNTPIIGNFVKSSLPYTSVMDLEMTRQFIKATRTTPPLWKFRRSQKTSSAPASLEKNREYETFDNLRAGACSGVLTTIGRMFVDRQPIRKLYPVLREIGPNVAIYFTTYEETKRLIGRNSETCPDIGIQCFLSGCVGGFFAYLPRNHFNPLVPLQFGIHFSIFEMAKHCISLHTGRKRLTVADVGSTAILGGICGSCVTYPLGNLGANLKVAFEGGTVSLTKGLTSNFLNHITRSSPGWAITACGFEFSRRVITQT